MSLAYFLTPDPLGGTLTGPEAAHAHVKRVAPGEHIVLIDGSGLAAEVVVGQASKSEVRGEVLRHWRVPEPAPRVRVVQAIPKSERAELAVDLAVQAGADEIIPWISHRTIARWPEAKQAKQVEKWRNQAVASAKQARRAWVPEVSEPVTSNQLAALARETQALVLHEDAEAAIKDIEFSEECLLIIGPEGGIGADELELIGGTPVRLGPEVLRTASAAFAGLCAIGALTHRW